MSSSSGNSLPAQDVVATAVPIPAEDSLGFLREHVPEAVSENNNNTASTNFAIVQAVPVPDEDESSVDIRLLQERRLLQEELLRLRNSVAVLPPLLRTVTTKLKSYDEQINAMDKKMMAMGNQIAFIRVCATAYIVCVHLDTLNQVIFNYGDLEVTVCMVLVSLSCLALGIGWMIQRLEENSQLRKMVLELKPDSQKLREVMAGCLVLCFLFNCCYWWANKEGKSD
ncbi:expressed unknown protein [Seminavis robusta]|uniref:Transmembrane protein n=1 Tax=Seminavis robusta TaxID=568900 RepID=A0A9N8HWZ0_9STRA|nr:expressed unknown protein [Seminavis robusta]|eukprot:Sro2850_g338550.1 n/a (226) ;mRNA; f:7668-8345